jgi:Rieske Fe-S protein
LAFIGRNPSDHANVYIATGDSGNGMTHGTIAGILITDLILGRDNPWARLYDPARTSLRSAGEFAKENVNVVAQYTDLLTPGDVDDASQIAPGHGAVIRRGASKVAIARAPDGTLHERSAICPHLGCVVQWNSAEQTWDCPCHGSRFGTDGHVLNGPATGPLAKP